MPDTPDKPEPEDLIRYDILAQEALRGVVKKVLQEVSKTGLPGDHHFYITFDTNHPGVRLSSRMKEKYPEEMTIVVQHQFWDLEATENGFSIGLSFDNIPEALTIPFLSIRGFFDPSVQFGLQFDADTDDETDDADASADQAPKEIEAQPAKVSALPAPEEDEAGAQKDKADEEVSSGPEETADGASADVVSLDAFRKK